jgi:hypothetical protein
MKKQTLLISLLILILFSCQKERSFERNGSSQVGGSSQVDVYVAGADSVFAWAGLFNSTYGIPTYWKNGIPVNYTDGTISYRGTAGDATSIAVSGNDVYMTGYGQFCGSFRCGEHGLFWKNGISESLDLPTYPTSLTVSNNYIYIAGSAGYLTGTGGNAAYLKNEVKIELPSGSAGSISTAIAVSGNHVYVAGLGITGNIFNGNQNYIAKYWKNGNAINLTDGTNGAQVWSIAVSGNDAYVAGMEWNGKSYQDASGNTYKKSVAKYWKNSIAVILTDGTEHAITKSIAVSGTDVYVAGTEWNGKSYQDASGYTHKKSIAKYWKNGKAVNLTDGTEDAEAKSIAVSGNDVYVAGTVNGYATYWKNGVAVKLSNVESDANSIFLVKK